MIVGERGLCLQMRWQRGGQLRLSQGHEELLLLLLPLLLLLLLLLLELLLL